MPSQINHRISINVKLKSKKLSKVDWKSLKEVPTTLPKTPQKTWEQANEVSYESPSSG